MEYNFAAWGNDSTGNGSITAPYQSSTKANALMASAIAGDIFSFNGGDTFTGKLVPISNITIQSWGIGQAKFTLTRITGWSGPTSGVYSIAISNSTSFAIFYEDGIPILPKATSSACTDGKWYGDGTHLYYKPTSGDPTTHVITMGNLGSPQPGYVPLIDVTGLSNVNILNVALNSAGIGIKTYETTVGTSGITINNCTFNYSWRSRA